MQFHRLFHGPIPPSGAGGSWFPFPWPWPDLRDELHDWTCQESPCWAPQDQVREDREPSGLLTSPRTCALEPSHPVVRKLKSHGVHVASHPPPQLGPTSRHRLIWFVICLNTHPVFLGKEKGLSSSPGDSSPWPSSPHPQPSGLPSWGLRRDLLSPTFALSAWLTSRTWKPPDGFSRPSFGIICYVASRWPGQFLLRISSKWPFHLSGFCFVLLFFKLKPDSIWRRKKARLYWALLCLCESVSQWINYCLNTSPVTTEISISL